jgi:hypothetical protein
VRSARPSSATLGALTVKKWPKNIFATMGWIIRCLRFDCFFLLFMPSQRCPDGKKITENDLLNNRLSHLMLSFFQGSSAVRKVRWRR